MNKRAACCNSKKEEKEKTTGMVDIFNGIFIKYSAIQQFRSMSWS